MANRANVSSLSTDIINQVGYEPRHLIISSHPGVRSSGTAKQEEEEAEMAAGDAATPLLETAYQYHEGCPACAVERSKALNPGIPYMRFFHIWIIILVSCTYAPPIDHCFMHVEAYERGNMTENSESSRSRLSNSILGLPISSLFPFLYFMIRDLHVAKRVEDIGFYAGFVSTSWAIGLIVGPAIGGYLAQETLHKHATERNGDCKIGSLSTHLVDSEEFAKKHTGPAKDKSLFKNWPLMSSIVLFCIVSFDDMAYTEIFSLWSESDKQFGGLNFSSEDVGQVLAITGASILIYQTFIYPHIVKVLGIINTSRVALILSMALLCSYPPMTYLSRPWLSIVVNIASMLKNNFVCKLPVYMVVQPQHQRATANGLATTLMSFFKAFAPAGAGILFSWAQKRQHAFFFPGDQMFCFDFLLCIAMASTGDGAPGHGGNGGALGGGGNGGAPRDNTNGGNTNASTSLHRFLAREIGSSASEIGELMSGEEADHGRRWQAEAPLLEKKGSTGTGVGDGYCIEGCPGVIFNTLFGLSFTYWMAIATRFLLGALNGLLGPIKAYAIEVCRPEHEALALSLVSTAWGIGLIIGPAIGGYLSQETLHKHKADANRSQTVEALESHLIDPKEKADQNGSLDCKKSLLSNWPLMSSIILYCVFSFHDMAYTEIFSLWAESDRKYGGLSLSSEDVGQVLAITGASLLVYQLFIYPRINKILCIPILFAYPYMTYLSGPGLTIILNIASVIKNNLGVTIITGCFILQNNAVPQDQRGAANGLAMTGMSFFKAVAPAGAGIVFSWAQKRQHASFLPGDQMVFFLLNIFELLGLILTFKPFLAVPQQHDTN
uniref:Major facilitator superfamily (MFS) profile domain-containing protein n=1 Tax=Oryza meridionalis TaxID=40149 RepID=A0A0E0F2D9_9ORYZ